jgi:GTP-binding protein
MYPRITIVGRPNVGKSSLFNIITGHRIAIVSDIENTTRDIVEYDYRDEENETIYTISDSGGLVDGDDDTILKDVRERTEEAIKSSDIILFALEYDKITTLDEHIAKKLRRSKKPVIVLANKADNPRRALE